MAKSAFDFSDVFAELEEKIDKYMKSPDTHEQIAKKFAYETGEHVYGKYDNQQYERRLGQGGLGDWENYEVIDNGKMSVIVTNETKGNERYADMTGGGYDPGYINDIIESGSGYWWTRSQIYKEKIPRPFMDIAADKVFEEIILHDIHVIFFDD